jgi:hypothetical protein
VRPLRVVCTAPSKSAGARISSRPVIRPRRSPRERRSALQVANNGAAGVVMPSVPERKERPSSE